MNRTMILAALAVTASGAAQSRDEIVGNVRIQVLSDSVIRIEQKGPKGWENRPTFHIDRKQWRGAAYWAEREEEDELELFTDVWKLKTPKHDAELKDIEIFDRKTGKLLWEWDGKLPNSVWLPSPSSKPKVWWFADAPRIVPPKWGLTPAPNASDPTSGWDIGNSAPDIYVFLPNGNYKQLRQDFIELTGRAEMPPIYLFGFIHSRYHPYSDKSALELIDKYRQRQFPLDVFVIDTDWRIGASHGYASNTKLFPDMKGFLQDAHQKNVRTMFNDHPEPQAPTAVDPKELQYRSQGLTQWLKAGLDVWWYDRNWSVGLREPLPNLRKEVWGMMLYRDITQAAKPGLRPAIMANVDGIDNGYRNRPPNIAAHRYPIQWTGDQGPSFQYLRFGVENAVYSGVHTTFAYMSEDLGGHTGHPSPELFTRFFQYGALSPTMRLHYTAGLPEREPWAWGTEIEQICRDYAQMRYRLLPLFYAGARENYEIGEPILRRCDLDYPGFKEAERNDQYLLGKGILVAPIVDGAGQKSVPGSWLKTEAGEPGFSATYFNNRTLEGPPALQRTEKNVDFIWSTGSPSSEVQTENFSARFSGKVGPIPGSKPIKLGVVADDGVRLWINGKLVVDKWVPQDSVLTFAPTILQPGETYDVRVEYMEIGGNATCKLVYTDAYQDPVSKREAWIPPGQWMNAWNGQVIKGPTKITAQATFSQIPLFLKAGTIVPLVPVLNYFKTQSWADVTLDVYPMTTGRTSQLLYQDDQMTNAYKQGSFQKTLIDMQAKGKSLELNIRPTSQSKTAYERNWNIRLNLVPGWTPGKSVRRITVDGKSVTGWKIYKQDNKVRMPLMADNASRASDVLMFSLKKTRSNKATRVIVSFN